MVDPSQCHLSHLIQALRPARGLAGSLYGRQQERDEHGDDGDHHQQFHEGKTAFGFQGSLQFI